MPKRAKHEIDAKVVHLEPESQRIVRVKLAKMPPAVQAVHEKGKHIVLGLLKSFFDEADDSLFELADKAESNQEQNVYFDSMREVRVQRRSIEKHFADAIDEAFSHLVSPGSELSGEAHKPFSSDALALVDNDELEEIVAVDSTVARANKDFGEAIQLISLRLDSLVPVKVYQEINPLGPDILCATFMAETKKLDIGIKSKLVLFKIFDKSVVKNLSQVYSIVNEIFRENNILPSLSAEPRGASDRRRSASDQHIPLPTDIPMSGIPASAIDAADVSHVSPEVLSTLKHLLGEKVLSNPSLGTQTQLAASDLINLLSRVQQMPSVMNNQVAINVRSLLAQLQHQTGMQASIGQVDDQVMNLVNLLFDFILEDRNLAQPMKALISRMQIPIIKVAVADKSFFTKSGHVARKLLNEMATAAMGWNGDGERFREDPLYKKIEAIVHRLLEEFDTDLSIFGELLADFSEFVQKEKRRADVLERRTIDAEDGKAKAEVARKTVALEIEVRTADMRIPKVVRYLIKDAWSNVLFVTALKYGYDSKEWKGYLKVLENLVWSVQVPTSVEHRQKLIKLVPALLRQLRAGLDTISYNPFEMSDLFKSLEKVHIACIRGRSSLKQQSESIEPAKDEKAVDTEAVVEADPTRQVSEKLAEPEPRKIDKKAEVSRPVQNVEARDTQKVVDKTLEPFLGQVAAFGQGSWFDMVDDSGESIRSRLAAFIKPTGKYIFVNRNGMKVAEKTQEELAIALRENKLQTLDNSMLFDRALETVVSSLRKS